MMRRWLTWFAATILVIWLLMPVTQSTVGQTPPNFPQSEQLVEAEQLNQQAIEFYNQGEWEEALATFKEALAIVREIPLPPDNVRIAAIRQKEGDILYKMGESYNQLSQYQQAAEFHEQALVINRELGDCQKQGNSLNWLGLLYEQLGEYQRSLESYEQALVINRELGNHYEEMLILLQYCWYLP